MNREVDGESERQRRQHSDWHVVVLADEPDQPVGEDDGDRERNHRQHAVNRRAEQDHHHEEHDDERAHQALEHPADHLVLPNSIEIGETGPFGAETFGGWVRCKEHVEVGLHRHHVLVVATL